jgi:hypothetical protein
VGRVPEFAGMNIDFEERRRRELAVRLDSRLPLGVR